MARGDVLTELCERKRFLKSSPNASSMLTDHLSPFTYLSCRSPMKDEGKSLELGAVSSVVEHYLDTVGVTGSNPVSRTISSSALQRLTHFHQNKRFDCNTFLPDGLIQVQASDLVFADDDGCLFVKSEMSTSYWQPPGPFGSGNRESVKVDARCAHN